MAINLTKNRKTMGITLKLSCTEFIDWFLTKVVLIVNDLLLVLISDNFMTV